MAGDFTVGNLNGDCDIKLDDEYVSNRHARFYQQAGAWLAEDLGSTNGVFTVPGIQREWSPIPLRQGSKIRVGHTILTVVPT